VDIVNYLMKLADITEITDGADRNVLFSAIHCDWSEEVILALLDGGFPIERRNKLGQTALHHAIAQCQVAEGDVERKQRKSMILLLLDRGPNLLNVDTKGDTTLGMLDDDKDRTIHMNYDSTFVLSNGIRCHCSFLQQTKISDGRPSSFDR
jgi:ankyrin repeat protein